MPPVGNFAVPASGTKDNKKRPRVGVSVVPSGAQPQTSDVGRGMGPGGPGNKVSRLTQVHMLLRKNTKVGYL